MNAQPEISARRALRDAFGSYMTGVTVVTALNSSGEPVGFTANSFTSVSMEPPMILVCPAKTLSSYAVFEECTHFAVNVLAEDQQSVSNTFASFDGDRFGQVNWQADKNGCPVLDGVLASFSCSAAQRIDAGDHMVLLGEVCHFGRRDGHGLGYASGNYFSLGLERRATSMPDEGFRLRSGILLTDGDDILMVENHDTYALPEIELEIGSDVRAELKTWLSENGLDATIGHAYSIYTDRQLVQQCNYFLAELNDKKIAHFGEFVPIDQVSAARVKSKPHEAILRRFAKERRNMNHYLYVGDERDGDTHPLSQEV